MFAILMRLISPKSILTMAMITGLAGCATTYGTSVGAFGSIDVRSRRTVKTYQIIRLVDFEDAFPAAPSTIPVSDNRLSIILSERRIYKTNDGAFSYRSGNYYLSYRCASAQIFKRITINSEAANQIFQIDCK